MALICRNCKFLLDEHSHQHLMSKAQSNLTLSTSRNSLQPLNDSRIASLTLNSKMSALIANRFLGIDRALQNPILNFYPSQQMLYLFMKHLLATFFQRQEPLLMRWAYKKFRTSYFSRAPDFDKQFRLFLSCG